MLTKIQSEVVRQPDRRIRRAWYQCASADVLLEHDVADGSFLSFEIEGDGGGGRRWFVSWGRAVGLRTGVVDMGEGDGLSHKASPVVLYDFKNRPDRVDSARRLVEGSAIEEGLREAILRRLGS
jgi:hypothetical protein